MKNKTWKYWVVASIALLLVGCGGGAKKQTNEEVSMSYGEDAFRRCQ